MKLTIAQVYKTETTEEESIWSNLQDEEMKELLQAEDHITVAGMLGSRMLWRWDENVYKIILDEILLP